MQWTDVMWFVAIIGGIIIGRAFKSFDIDDEKRVSRTVAKLHDAVFMQSKSLRDVEDEVTRLEQTLKERFNYWDTCMSGLLRHTYENPPACHIYHKMTQEAMADIGKTLFTASEELQVQTATQEDEYNNPPRKPPRERDDW